MSEHAHGGLSAQHLAVILEVTRRLAAPFDLNTMLAAVTAAARQVLHAERSSVWLLDTAANELVLTVSSDLAAIRIPVGAGMVGACAQERRTISVPDCYADPRFDRRADQRSGYRTRCALTLPLLDHRDTLVGVMQVLNRTGGIFDAADEVLAGALAAQCAVALQRVQMIEALIESEKMRAELELARVVQMSTLPATMPVLPGYDAFGTFKPAALTGGDTFDLSLLRGQLLVVLGDATGHGIAPALSVTQMHAMLRMAFRLGTDLEAAFAQVNDQLADTLPDDRFITAFIGLLDPATHRLRFLSAGQGPILHFRAATGTFARYKPTSFPLGAMHLPSPRAASVLDLLPGDVLLVLSDGIYEQHEAGGEMFGEPRVERLVAEHHARPMTELSAILLEAVHAFARGTAQEDDITIVLLKRETVTAARSFRRSVNALSDIFAFSAQAFVAGGIEAGLLPAIDFVLEELFTNTVKYSQSEADIRIEIDKIAGGVEVVMTDEDVDFFDVTAQAPVDVSAPIDSRRPGGLGLHLIPRMVDSIEYDYLADARRSRITLRKTRT